MGTLFGFIVGYVVGARAGSDSFDEVVDAIRQIRDSDEFQGFLRVVRDHARDTAATVATRLSEEGGPRATAEDLIERARTRATGG